MKFEDLNISLSLVERLHNLSIDEPMPIQQLVIPAALRGENLVAISPTGSGKSLAYLLPLLTKIEGSGHRALLLLPTRELAQQVGVLCSQLCEGSALSTAVIVGGVEYAPQREVLAAEPNIIVATPGRLLDLVDQSVAQLDNIGLFVLDEVDQMVDMGFRDTIMRLSQLRAASAQTLCFSATLPEDVQGVVGELVGDVEPLRLADNPLSVASIDHFGYYVSFDMMDSLLLHLVRTEAPRQAIVFTRSRKMADRVVALLGENSIAAEAMHSDRSQAAREHIVGRFRSGETSMLVATDIMARGIDVDTVTHVFNFGLPQSAEQYIHRVGRCGRAGREGRAISLFTPEERPMVDAICRLMKRHIVIDSIHPYMTQAVSQALNPLKPAKVSAKSSAKSKSRKTNRR